MQKKRTRTMKNEKNKAIVGDEAEEDKFRNAFWGIHMKTVGN